MSDRSTPKTGRGGKPSAAIALPGLREGMSLRRADIAAGKLVLRKRGAGGALLLNKQRVNIFLDSAVIEHFKSKAGDRGYQTLINETLKQAIRAESIDIDTQPSVPRACDESPSPASHPP